MKLYYYFGIGLFVVILDLITKNLAETHLSDKTVSIIPGFFDLVLVWNTGAAFGILAQAPDILRKAVLIGSSTIAAIVATLYVLKKRSQLSKMEVISLALIAGGAVGNLYDRLFLGAVRDFLDFYIKEHHWPAFNVADASISIGITIFLFLELYHKKRIKV